MAVLLATVDELNAWTEDSVNETRAELVLAAVSGSAIRIAAPASASWSSADTAPDEVKALVLQVAARVIENPAAFQSKSETVGGYSGTVSTAQERGVSFTEAERLALLDAAGLNITPQGVRATSVTFC
jgi:hypothetical protein